VLLQRIYEHLSREVQIRLRQKIAGETQVELDKRSDYVLRQQLRQIKKSWVSEDQDDTDLLRQHWQRRPCRMRSARN
jgi:ATP-dependent Lon protease